ncbi:cyclin-domain-containing protein, partial [Catenaria anguillulae PL171]
MDLLSFPVKETVRMMASLLEHITNANDQLPLPGGVVSRFHARSVPPITIHSYLARILKYAPCANLVFISVLVYLDRMARAKVPFVVCSANIHRLLIAAVMVATKFYSDVFYTNAHYARVGGLQVAELNQLELEFLFMNEFNLTISPQEFQHYADRL